MITPNTIPSNHRDSASYALAALCQLNANSETVALTDGAITSLTTRARTLARGACSDRLTLAATHTGPGSEPATRPEQAYGACISDRKSTRLNSSHLGISYAVFCLKKKT